MLNFWPRGKRPELLIAITLVALLAWWKRPAATYAPSLAGYRLGDGLPLEERACDHADPEELFHQLTEGSVALIADDSRRIRGIASASDLRVAEDKVLTRHITMEAISRILGCPVTDGNRFALGDKSVYVKMDSFWGGASAYVLIDERWNRSRVRETGQCPIAEVSLEGRHLGDSAPRSGNTTKAEDPPKWVASEEGRLVNLRGFELTLDGVRYSGRGSIPGLIERLGPCSLKEFYPDGERYEWSFDDVQIVADVYPQGVRFLLTDWEAFRKSLLQDNTFTQCVKIKF